MARGTMARLTASLGERTGWAFIECLAGGGDKTSAEKGVTPGQGASLSGEPMPGEGNRMAAWYKRKMCNCCGEKFSKKK